jgi:uncharacterized oligopeptide transporter (OPT) family protein
MAEAKEQKKFTPYVSAETNMAEFTIRALIIGLVMCVVLGAANAYLGLKAGMTIAATYPAAVIGMAVLRLFKGTILEENFARTVGSIGESVAAGAIFTIPAFLIAGVWPEFASRQHYLEATAIMFVGGVIGILFVTILRRVMVEDPELPFPESVAAAEIHKAGRSGKNDAKFLFFAMGLGVFIEICKQLKFFAASWDKFIAFAQQKLAIGGGATAQTGGGALLSTPGVSPAYIGVGYIIGPKLAALNFTGGLLAWGLFVPLLFFFLGHNYDIESKTKENLFASVLNEKVAKQEQAKYSGFYWFWYGKRLASKMGDELKSKIENKKASEAEQALYAEAEKETSAILASVKEGKDCQHVCAVDEARNAAWVGVGTDLWKNVVRKIAIGGMLMSAAFTLYRMRKNLSSGLKRAIGDVKKAAGGGAATEVRTERDLNFKWVFIGIGMCAVATFGIYYYFAQNITAALVATIVMVIAGFFFAAVSGYLVGMIGSSNNPISGLTISTLLIAALLLVALGFKGTVGIATVLGVAAVICVSAAVAGEMLQDLKVGHILGGTPKKMQLGDLIGVLLASVVMFIPLVILHQGDISMGGTGLGGSNYSAPQASLMAILAKGIVGGDMAWPLIIVGILMAFGFILLQVKSPMLVCVGMYLPLETTFAIFIGGLIKGIVERVAEKRKYNEAQKVRSENNGILLASGLIAGEALTGLLFAFFALVDWKTPMFPYDRFWVSTLVFVLVAYVLIKIPLDNAGKPDEPAPASAAF